ncbi:prepilin peptidase, partial [Catenibacterium faecis]
PIITPPFYNHYTTQNKNPVKQGHEINILFLSCPFYRVHFKLTAGFLFVLFYIHDGLSILYLSHIASLTCFYIISIIDLHLYEIPDIYLLISLLSSFKIIYLKESLLFILFLILFVYLFYKITGKEGLGGGDIKMLGVCSLSLGIYQTLSVLSIACFLGIIFSFIKQKKMIPFGPFIALGWLTISLFDSFLIL